MNQQVPFSPKRSVSGRIIIFISFLLFALIVGLSIPAILIAGDGEWAFSAFASILLLATSCAILGLAIRGAFVLPPVILFLIYYILFLYIGAFIRFIESPQEYSGTLRIISFGIFFFSLGSYFASLLRNFNSEIEFNRVRAQALSDPWGANMLPVTLLFGAGLLLSLFYFFVSGIPFFAEVLETARVEATAGNGYFLLGISAVLPFSSLVFIGKALARRKLKETFIAVCAVIVTSGVMLLAALKDLVPFFLLWIVFLFQFYYGRLSKKMLLVPVVSVAIAIVMAGYTMKHKIELGFADGSVVEFALEMVSYRIFFAVVDVVHFIFVSFPDIYDYWYGYSYWMNLVAAAPGADVGLGGWINEEAFGMGGGATVPVVAEFYLNFGEAGTYIGMFLVGIGVQSVYIMLLRKYSTKKRVDYLVGLTFFGMGLVSLAINSVFGYLLYTLLPVLACFIGLQVLNNIISRNVRKRVVSP